MSEKWYVVNEKGEVLREASPNERVISNGQSDYLLGTEKIDFDFVKLNTRLIGDLGSLLRYVIELLPYIEIGTGILKFGNGVKFKNNKSFMKVFKVKEGRTDLIVYQLKKDDIIHKCKNAEDGIYFVFNPFIAHCSRRVPKELYKEFLNSKWRGYCD